MSKSQLQQLTGDQDQFMSWVRDNIQNVTEQELRQAINGDMELTELILSNLNLAENPIIKPFVQSMLRSQWELIEDLLTDPQGIYDLVVEERPDLEPIISSSRGIEWLNNACDRGYNKLYNYAWE